ncbi:MAG: DUF4870 domain-containing protein [Candidatus Magasanikbacteria bacterium]
MPDQQQSGQGGGQQQPQEGQPSQAGDGQGQAQPQQVQGGQTQQGGQQAQTQNQGGAQQQSRNQPNQTQQQAQAQNQGPAQQQNRNQQNQAAASQGGSGSSTGLDENIAGALAYALGFITGIIFLVIEEDSNFVKFHAIQSIITSLSLYIFFYILEFIPIIGFFVALFSGPLIILVILFLIYKAWQGEMFKLPVIGDIAENQL